jgi:hypothetical protein
MCHLSTSEITEENIIPMSQEEVRGKQVRLRPAMERDKRRIYEWAKWSAVGWKRPLSPDNEPLFSKDMIIY